MNTTTNIIEPANGLRGDKLAGRVALVTGGTRGIGASICRSLASQGASVAAGFSGNRDRAEQFVKEFERDFDGAGRATVHQGNVSQPEDCRRVVQEVLDQHGRIDILVNNAGITMDKMAMKMSIEDWNTVLAVNLSGSFYMAQPVLEHMVERGTGRIIFVSSVIGETGAIGQANYAASKAGMLGLTKTLAKEAAFILGRAGRNVDNGVGITVNTVTPGMWPPRCSRLSLKRCWTRSGRRFRSAGCASPKRSPGSSTSSQLTPRPTSPDRSGGSTGVWTCSHRHDRRTYQMLDIPSIW